MTYLKNSLPPRATLVLAIDMCCSSKFINDLFEINKLDAFHDLLNQLYHWLEINRAEYRYEIYQFTGDGWILLFHGINISGLALMELLVRFSQEHNNLRKSLIDVHLSTLPESFGLTFGIDAGTLNKFSLGADQRYVGVALNVACKLQDAVKQKGPEQENNYRCLLSNVVYHYLMKYRDELRSYTFLARTRSLRNIDQSFKCRKVNLSKFVI